MSRLFPRFSTGQLVVARFDASNTLLDATALQIPRARPISTPTTALSARSIPAVVKQV